MTEQKGPFKPSGLLIEYKPLGVIPIDELFHAIRSDIEALKDIHNVEFVKHCRLKLVVTDGYGQEVTVRRAGGAPMYRMYTYHHKPACKDYEL